MQNNPNRTSIFIFWLKGYTKLVSLSLLGMTAFRLIWFTFYKKGDEISHFFYDFLKALVLGMRFDLSTLCYITFPSLLLWVLWFIGSSTPFIFLHFDILKLQRRYWVLMLLTLIFLLAADFNYYGYFQDHFNVLIFGFLHDDTTALLKTFWKNYPIVKIIIILSITGWAIHRGLLQVWKDQTHYNLSTAPSTILSPNTTIGSNSSLTSIPLSLSPSKSWILAPIFIFFFFAISLGARGSLGLFPLEIMHTAISPNSFINSLSFNSIHALARAIQLRDQQGQKWNENLLQLGYSPHPTQALKDFTELNQKSLKELSPDQYQITSLTSTHSSTSSATKLPHLVVVLMESWGSDWMSEQTSTFNILGALDKHIKENLFTPHILPSHVATIGSLGSLTVDLPHRLFSPFLTESAFLGVEFQQAPARFLREKGYETHFIYGGNLGWRSIDQFLPRQGFQFLHGDHDIQKLFTSTAEENIIHDWGIHDEYVFQYAKILLEKATKPQFLFILTTTNHPPYLLPKNYRPPPLQLPEALAHSITGNVPLALDRLKAYQYSNDQLGLFLDQLKTLPLSDNTILAATGDHSFYIRPYDNLQFFKKWSVPLLISAPKRFLPEPSPKTLGFGSHLDIFPTLYNLIFSDTPYFSLGHDLLDPSQAAWAYHAPSWSSFDQQSGIIINAKGEIISSLCKSPSASLDEYQPCPKSTSHELLQKRLLSLMGTADYIFEGNRIMSHQNSSSLTKANQ